MIKISKATRPDLPAIQELMLKYGNKMVVESHHLNKRDVALQARNSDGKLVGFMWAGLMANNAIAYIDKVAVDPEFAHQQITQKLYFEAFRIGKRIGVKEFFGIIKQDTYHDKAAINALRVCTGGDDTPYTYVRAQLKEVLFTLEKEFGIKIGD